MSKDNWDDQEDNQQNLENSNEDDDWGVDTDDSPSTSSLLSSPSSGDDTWEDDADSVQNADGDDPDFTISTNEDWDDGEEDGDEDGDEDDDLFNQDDAQSEDKGKKKSKLKTYALIGGMTVFVAGILGGGYMMTAGKSAPPQRPQPMMPVPPPAQERELPVYEEEQVEAEPIKPNVVTPPVEMDLEVEQRIQERPIDRDVAHAASAAIEDLLDKTDMLASAVTDLKDQSNQHVERMASFASTSIQVTDHEARIAELETQLKEMGEFIAKLKEDQTKKPAPRKPAAKAAPAKKAAPKKAEPKKESAKPAAPAKRAAPSAVAGYSVVATYPSTSSDGMKPERAWVTNGEQLVQVVVGSTVNGAKVTKIEGTTVHTNKGVIRSPR